jgi:hypothetical protein
MSTNYYEPFCDWLSISHTASTSPANELVAFINSIIPLTTDVDQKYKEVYKSGNGSIHINRFSTSISISMSGGILSAVRESGLLNELTMILGSTSYNITRLDAAIDIPLSGISSLSRVRKLYPKGIATLSGRLRNLLYVLNPLNDKTETGTVYFQNKSYKGHIFLRMYDKAFEALNRSIVIPPTTRYELTIKRGASLRDLINPTDLLFNYLPTELLSSPKTLIVKPWKPIDRSKYDVEVESLITDYEQLKSILESHPGLNTIIEYACTLNGGSSLLTRYVEKCISANAEGMKRSGNNCDVDTSANALVSMNANSSS